MTEIHPAPFNPGGDLSAKGKPSSELRTWKSVRNSVLQGSTDFHQYLQHTAGHDLSFAKHDSVVLVPQPMWEGPGCY